MVTMHKANKAPTRFTNDSRPSESKPTDPVTYQALIFSTMVASATTTEMRSKLLGVSQTAVNEDAEEEEDKAEEAVMTLGAGDIHELHERNTPANMAMFGGLCALPIKPADGRFLELRTIPNKAY